MHFSYDYIAGDFKFIDLAKLKSSLLNYIDAENTSEWAESWINVLLESINQQKNFFQNRINQKQFNQILDSSNIEFINIGWLFNSELLQGFVNISEVLKMIRPLHLTSITTSTELLLDNRFFQWKPTLDTDIKLSNLDQPILALPLVNGKTYMILDGNHRATHAILTSQKTIEIIYIDREKFFLNLQFFPSKFAFYACSLVMILHEMNQIQVSPSIPYFIPQSFFPSQTTKNSNVRKYWSRSFFRM